MRAGDLISDTRWRPGSDYAAERAPAVSVLLPTFARNADGLLGRAIASVLEQTLADLELIVVDDGSTDGSAETIAHVMRHDGRVSCLTHPRNLGLPALAEFEAYRRARGGRIAFAFDDFLFEADALAGLLRTSDAHRDAPVHGHIVWRDPHGTDHLLGKDVADYDRLWVTNIIGNAGVMLPRSVIEDVGLYDPHVAAARICDWDLWRRIHARHRWVEAPVLVGREFGPARADSLGLSYPMTFEIAQEIVGTARGGGLRPGALAEREVWSLEQPASLEVRRHAKRSRDFFRARTDWARAAGAPDDVVEARAIVGVVGDYSGPIARAFAELPDGVRGGFLFIDPSGWSLYRNLSLLRCDRVLLSDAMDDAALHDAARFCAIQDIPCGVLLHPGGQAPEPRPGASPFAPVVALQGLDPATLLDGVTPHDAALRDERMRRTITECENRAQLERLRAGAA